MKAAGNVTDDFTLTDKSFSLSEDFATVATYVSYTGLCQAINIFGIITNIINIFCFVKQGFQDSVNINLLGLAVSDLGSLTTLAFTCVFVTPTVMSADLPFEPMDVAYLTSSMLHLAFTRVSSCLTALITLERCLCITIPLQIKSIVTPKRTTVGMACVFILLFFSGAPVYAVNSLGMTFSPSRNKTLIGRISTEEREHVERITITINNFFIPFIMFMIIVVCTTILSVKLRDTTRWREKTITSSQVDRLSVRNQKTAKMVVMISTLFIVCFVPMCVIMLMFAFFQEMRFEGKYVQESVLLGGIGCILEGANSSLNIFIYYRLSTKYREVFSIYIF